MNKRRAKSTARRRRWFPAGLALMALSVGMAAGVLSWWLAPSYGCVTVKGTGTLLLNVDPLARGAAQKYCWTPPGQQRTVRFIVARQNDGAINVVLDACRVCYLNNLGYRSAHGSLICRYCSNRYSIDSLSAGTMSCSPFKVPFEVDRGWLKIEASKLSSMAIYFPAQAFNDASLRAAFQWLGNFSSSGTRMADAIRPHAQPLR
jgi:uncharacterized membrane protein